MVTPKLRTKNTGLLSTAGDDWFNKPIFTVHLYASLPLWQLPIGQGVAVPAPPKP